MNYLELGPTPIEEESAQIGTKDFEEDNRIECLCYKHQLQRLFPNASLGIKKFKYDFGDYKEVVAYYEEESDEDEQSVITAAAFEIESQLPNRWDELALVELKESGYTLLKEEI